MSTYLIVDDSATSRGALKQNLIAITQDEADVYEAESASQAITWFRTKKPDIVFLDMMLGPGPQGIDLLKSMLAERPQAKVVVITALAREDEDVISAMSMGAFGYLRKPIRLKEVKTILGDFDAESGRVYRIG